MNSQPPEEPNDVGNLPPQPPAGPEFVPPLTELNSDDGPPTYPTPYDIAAEPPAKRYRNGVVWAWVFIGGAVTSLISPFFLGLLSSAMSSTSPNLGWLIVLVPLIGVVIGGVGLRRSRDDVNPTPRSIYMGLLIGCGLALTCVGACYGIIIGSFSGSGN